jgi:hypothetical protein
VRWWWWGGGWGVARKEKQYSVSHLKVVSEKLYRSLMVANRTQGQAVTVCVCVCRLRKTPCRENQFQPKSLNLSEDSTQAPRDLRHASPHTTGQHTVQGHHGSKQRVKNHARDAHYLSSWPRQRHRSRAIPRRRWCCGGCGWADGQRCRAVGCLADVVSQGVDTRVTLSSAEAQRIVRIVACHASVFICG